MVTRNRQVDEVLRALREWAQRLPTGSVILEEKTGEYTIDVHVRPGNKLAMDVWLAFSDPENFSLSIGRGVVVDDVPLASDYVIEICDAVSRGQVEEEIVMRGGWEACRTVVHLPSGDLQGEELMTRWGVLGVQGKEEVKKRRYEPYS